MEKKIKSIILAAGKGTRMKSEKSKLVHKIYGKELVKRVVETANKSGVDEIVAIVGYKREQVQLVLGDSVQYAYQEEMLGTGHAVMQAEEYLKDKNGKVVVLNGDVPILRPETLKKLIQKSVKHKEYATVLTAIYDNPTGYGRVVRDIGGNITGIIEEKDATEEQKAIRELKPVSITHYDELYYAFQPNPSYNVYIKENCPDLEECKVNDVYVYDFGVNSAGICKVKIKGEKGQKIRLKHGEMMIEGKFNMNSIYFQRPDSRLDEYEYKQTDEYILKGGEEAARAVGVRTKQQLLDMLG